MLVRALLIFDALVALVILYFFVIGIGDGSVSADNGELWAVILAAIAATVLGGIVLNARGQRVAAIGTLLLLAIPGGLFTLFMAMVLILQPRWN
jgi:hypothetical protein